MAENVLISYVNGKIGLENIREWLNSPQNLVTEGNETIFCDIQDFVSYFLNFIHDEVIQNRNNESLGLVNSRNTANSLQSSRHNKSIRKKSQSVDRKKSNTPEKPEFLTDSSDFPGLQHTSTPKTHRNRSDLNSTWPRNGNESSRSQRHLRFQKDHNLRLGDFVVSKRASVRTPKRRRIKPTFVEEAGVKLTGADEFSERNVQNKENVERFERVFGGSSNNIEMDESQKSTTFVEIPCKNIEESRNRILEDLVELQRNTSKIETTCLNFNNLGKMEIPPNFGNCTNTSQISLVVDLYLVLIKNSFILNVLAELYFLISLLTIKQYKDNNLTIKISQFNDTNDLKGLFRTLPNQVYFSLETLKALTGYLRIFDKSTLNLLVNNQRLQNFAKDRYAGFRNDLNQLINEKQFHREESASRSPDVRNVNFTTETDNRDNFVSDASFHAFRKQRDAFYDVLRIWEDKRKSPEWNFAAVLAYKIRSLLGLCVDPVNLRQFARLFKSQLVLVCRRESEDELYMQNEEAILQHFPTMDSSKLNKLKLRLLSKSENVELDAPPSFPGYQEFFRDFILTCSNGSFLEHLKDVILAEILEENDYKFSGYDLSHRENILKNQAVQSVDEKLTKLLVLAKFLGFLESLPFQCDHRRMSKRVTQNLIVARSYYRGTFDIDNLLTRAIKKNRITITTCWVVIYLSMLDYVTLRLPYFQTTMEILFCLYRMCQDSDAPDGCYSRLLLIVSLNWLFGLPHFPSEVYYKFLAKTTLKAFVADEELFRNVSEEYFLEILNGKVQNDFPIDKLNVITEHTLYVCYPALETFKTMLSSMANKEGLITKHITPLTKVEFQKTKEQVQKQLEEAFLNAQPHTVRKIIEFSTEKITSGCIQHISAELGQIKRDIALNYFNRTKNNSEIMKDGFKSILQEIRATCVEIASKIIFEKTDLAMKGLMPVDELPVTIKKCTSISTRICQEKIKMWLDTTLTLNNTEKSIIQERKKLMNKLGHKTTSTIPSGGKNTRHSEETLSAVKIVDKLKTLMINVIEDQDVTESNVEYILNNCKDTIENRCDVNDSIMLTIHKLSVELYIVLVCFKPDLARVLLGTFNGYWLHFNAAKELFKTAVSIRNVHMLSVSRNKRESWDVFANFLATINENGLVAADDFEQQCLSVFKQSWDEETLSDICNCYRLLIENFKDRNASFQQLLSFISAYCLDLNGF